MRLTLIVYVLWCIGATQNTLGAIGCAPMIEIGRFENNCTYVYSGPKIRAVPGTTGSLCYCVYTMPQRGGVCPGADVYFTHSSCSGRAEELKFPLGFPTTAGQEAKCNAHCATKPHMISTDEFHKGVCCKKPPSNSKCGSGSARGINCEIQERQNSL